MSFPISRYLNVRTAYHPVFAADGRALSFITNITGTAQVWQLDFRHGRDPIPWPEQLTFAADRVLKIDHSSVLGDGRLLYSHDVGGNENMQLFLLNPETGEEIYLTEGFENAMHISGSWAEDGNQFLFAANRRQPGLFDLYLQPLTGAATLVWQNETPGYLFEQLFAPDGKTAVVTRVQSATQVDLIQIDLENGTSRLLTRREPAWYGNLNFSTDGRALYMLTNHGSDFKRVVRLDLESGQSESVVEPMWDVDMLKISPDGRYLAYVINQGGESVLELLDLEAGTVRSPVIEGNAPGLIGWFDDRLSFTPDSQTLAFSYTSAARTSDIFVWSLDEQRATAVTRSSHGGIPPHQFTSPELIAFPTFDGRDIPAWYYKPNTGKKMPAVILVHGGPESQFRPNFNFLAQYLVHQGFAVLGPNVRGSTGYGKTYAQLDNVERRMDSVADLAHAAQWLKQQPDINSDQVVVYGGSYGGFMVLAALTHYPDLWAAGVNIVGISNFVTFLENTSDYRRAHREAEYGSLAADRDFLESIAPINHLDKLTAPLMVIHGANDPRVPLSEAEQLVTSLENKGVSVEFLIFDDEGHGVAKLKNKLVLYPEIVAFLEKVLSTNG